MIEEVKLSAEFRNDAFQSWKVSDSLVAGSTQRLLPGSLYRPPCGAVDFLRANAAARYNALHPLKRSVVVLTTASEGLELWELKFDETGQSHGDWRTIAKCIPAPVPTDEIGLPPSLVEAAPEDPTRILLFSTGNGDLALIDDAKPGLVSIGQPLASNDGKGFAPFSLLSAWKGEAGQVICIICMLIKHSCETWVIAVTPSGGELEIRALEKLQVHSEPPFFARASLNGDSVILAGSPQQTEPRIERKGLGASDADTSSCPPERWTDVCHESGPDDLGNLGQEPPCIICHYKRSSSGQGYTKEKEVVCHPHGYLGQCDSSSQFPLLGLTDDVDMAVIEPGVGESSGLQISHLGSVPAFAYVAAGKPQRKYLFIGPLESPISAVLIESERMIYVYGGSKTTTDAHGQFQVLDIQNYVAEGDIYGAHLSVGTRVTELFIVTKSALVSFRF
ncbi:hypothetical protein BSKO_01264 [Bryopsis sp. KO-2023]|nr:hypothetical protein BSKO_01264 [Bryopsis sp. KO-2023]